MKTIVYLLVLVSLSVSLFCQTEYKNEKYGFSAQVPSDWKVYGELKDDHVHHRAIIDWGMPKVYSELEKHKIENAVTITAYKREDIKNMDDLIQHEYSRISKTITSHEVLDSLNSHLVFTRNMGITYQTKIVFVYKNQIGYVIAFTATPGTYDINLSKFDDFVKTITFVEAQGSE